jgi:phosphate transport system substrate-binding protein
MKRNRKSGIVGKIMMLALIFGCALMVAATGTSAKTPAPAKKKLSGTIRVSGAWALYPMMVRWGEEFSKIYPDVRVDVSAGGAGKGVADALGGLVDIGMVSREIKPEEIKQGAAFVPVVKDAVFAIMSENNPALKDILAKGLKRQAFIDLWMGKKELTWGDSTGTADKTKVSLYTRSDSCGAAETWAKYLGGMQEDLGGIGVYGDPGISQAVVKDPAGIGYNNLNYAYDMKTGKPIAGLRIVPIDINENGKIDPNERLNTKNDAVKSVRTGLYPAPPARDLYIMTKSKFSGLTLEFARWILTDGQKYLDEVGYIALRDTQIKSALKTLRK